MKKSANATTDETEVDTTAPDSFDPLPLLANSYNFQDMLKASEHAEGLKTEQGRTNAFGSMAIKSAVLTEVLTGQDNPPLPEGTVLGETEDANGRKVTAPVAVADETADAE